MLNISPHSLKDKIDTSKYKSFSLFQEIRADKVLKQLLLTFLGLVLVVAFLPWTQNIRGNGHVTALSPSQRPQELNSVIDGRIEAWYVQEGDFVAKGDTIIFIREIKDEYFDPRLLERTQNQIDAKRESLGFYKEKIDALKSQVVAIEENRQLKLNQAKNYLRQAELQIQADSIDYEAAQTNLGIADRQLERQKELYDEGLKSLTDLEKRTSKYQESLAKKISVESKLLSSRNKLLNAKIELNSIYNEYTDKLQKARSSLFETRSMLQNAQAEVVKMENQLTNYQVRFGMYYITAPQDGYITRAVSTGIGENIKAGESLVSIMPAEIDYAVEMYIYPRDLPLFSVGNEVRLIFDGWPSIVFSGWPIITYGTFGGEVVAIDRFISPNGKYRILIAQDPDEPEWPDALRVGGGTNGLALLDTVPVWYEIWRQINGFPPNFYTPENTGNENMKAKDKSDSKEKK
ncbi:HlyD family secretion protein [Marivirga arenosa]|uniref:HlyD family efflux transporter periplasmic adaptor subunit n=1 Tax=Marivirga arenosa TaxID=3059076 RepID=A0AA51ZWB1_9BACT|nr:HlyD family efflux transporter periplasmic adaptor subunit [Marivirga sp. BKB1-2]WNB17973.1 HlyD family efflux transporter periplasmic adaptor subunit [Marivirga sp. BKB1-2]